MEVNILRDESGRAIGIHSLGHADYGDGKIDIVCAAISALELNFVNSVNELTNAKFDVHLSKEKGSFDFKLLGERNEKAELLLQSLLMGYQAVQEAYGETYLMIRDQEV